MKKTKTDKMKNEKLIQSIDCECVFYRINLYILNYNGNDSNI